MIADSGSTLVKSRAYLWKLSATPSRWAFYFLSVATKAVGELQETNNMVHLKQTELLEKLKVKAKQLQQYQVIIWHQSIVQHIPMARAFDLCSYLHEK